MNKCIVINGGSKINGRFTSGGAKNSALFLICAALLSDKDVIIENIPDISDIDNLLNIIKLMKVDYNYNKNEKYLEIYNQHEIINNIDKIYSSKLRASIVLLCPLIKRFNFTRIPLPGGDEIGVRSLDELFRALKIMGVETELFSDYILFRRDGPLKTFDINLKCKSHTVTMCLIMLGSIIEGKSTISNYSHEPEIKDLIFMMKKGGVNIIVNESNIEIEGVSSLNSIRIRTMADRTEIASYVIAMLVTNGQITLNIDDYNSLDKTFLNIIRNLGAKININNEEVNILGSKIYKKFKLETGPFPNFHSDLQSMFIPLANKCNGECLITEKMFENRYNQNYDFEKLGMNLKLIDNTLHILPTDHLETDKKLYCRDIRGGFALIVAALQLPKGYKSYIYNTEIIERGYEHYIDKFRDLGVAIQIRSDLNVKV